MSEFRQIVGLMPSGRIPAQGVVRLVRVAGALCLEKTEADPIEDVSRLSRPDYQLLTSTLACNQVRLPKLIARERTDAGVAVTYELLQGYPLRSFGERRYWRSVVRVLEWCRDTRDQRFELAVESGAQCSPNGQDGQLALVHGDLSPDNLLVSSSQIGVIDWDDVTVAHVWADAASLLLLSLVQRGGLPLPDAVALMIDDTPAPSPEIANAVSAYHVICAGRHSRRAVLESLISLAVKRESSRARSNRESVEWWNRVSHLLGRTYAQD